VAPPTQRAPVQVSDGVPGACDGFFQQLVNTGEIVPQGMEPGTGNSAWYQWWFRDPDDAAGAALSDAVQLDFL